MTIRGNRIIGSGILNCELYVGRLVWNRQKKLKNPDTGRYAYRLNPQSEWVFGKAPELRILPQELWDAAKARQDQLTALCKNQIDTSRAAMRIMVAKNVGLNATHRPRTICRDLSSAAAVAESTGDAAMIAMPARTMPAAMAATTAAPFRARRWKPES